MCVYGSATDTENMDPDDIVDSRRKMSADIQSLSVVDRHKTYNPNHYQDDTVCDILTHLTLIITIIVIIRLADIVVGGLIFYQGFFLSSFLAL